MCRSLSCFISTAQAVHHGSQFGVEWCPNSKACHLFRCSGTCSCTPFAPYGYVYLLTSIYRLATLDVACTTSAATRFKPYFCYIDITSPGSLHFAAVPKLQEFSHKVGLDVSSLMLMHDPLLNDMLGKSMLLARKRTALWVNGGYHSAGTDIFATSLVFAPFKVAAI